MSIIPYLFSGSALSAAGAFALFAVLGFLGIANMRGGYPALMIAGYVIALFLFGMNWWNSAKQDLENAELKDDIRDIKKVVVGVTIQNNANVIESTPQAILDTLEAQRKLLRDTTKDNFAFFKLKIDDPHNTFGPFQWWLDASGPVFTVNYWVSAGSANHNAKDPAYWSIDYRKPLIPIIKPGMQPTDRAFPVGDYIIEFDGLNGHWDERLTVYLENGELKQHIKVTGAEGKVLYDSEHPVSLDK